MRSDAIIIEKYLKRRKSKVLLKKLVVNQVDNIILDQFLRKILAKRMIKNGNGLSNPAFCAKKRD